MLEYPINEKGIIYQIVFSIPRYDAMMKPLFFTLKMGHHNAIFFLSFALLVLCSMCVSARIVEHTFVVQSVLFNRLCKDQYITVVNGSFPGPTIYAHEGDTLVVHVLNQSPYNMTIHWHGIKQYLSNWADGTEYITQCAIQPHKNFTYIFNVSGQEGTFWWHAHSGFHRVSVHGALIVYPKTSYPFAKPYEEVPIFLGEWWNQNITEVLKGLINTGNGPNSSDANLINGFPGDMYSCPTNERRRFLNVDQQNSTIKQSLDVTTNSGPGIFKVKVIPGKTYLFRIINAFLNINQFFKIADHNMTIVAIDGSYTKPYNTDVLFVIPGQSIDVLVTTNQPPALYYIASSTYSSSPHPDGVPHPIPATAIMAYVNVPQKLSTPKMPLMPDTFDDGLALNAYKGLRTLVSGRFREPVPLEVDEHMLVTIGLGMMICNRSDPYKKCTGPFDNRMAGALNNMSFLLPSKLSLLEAYYHKIDGIYTTDFPNQPPLKFNYINDNYDGALLWRERVTKVKKLKYNATVEIVFQNTAFVLSMFHSMHFHGFNVHVLGTGLGNYNAARDRPKFNLVDPPIQHTISVPSKGWVAARFRADNPGVWYYHCHNEGHNQPIGMSSAFIIEDGPTSDTTLPPPPSDFPQC
ncbi:hypothetical protein Leryth_018657 [Lithospermum erythrorhizon]|nr:hypothetical protein Leryth_018657 [Lithospermum erythrorhizon]